MVHRENCGPRSDTFDPNCDAIVEVLHEGIILAMIGRDSDESEGEYGFDALLFKLVLQFSSLCWWDVLVVDVVKVNSHTCTIERGSNLLEPKGLLFHTTGVGVCQTELN